MILRRTWTLACMAGVWAAGAAGDGVDPRPVKPKTAAPSLKQRLEEADAGTLPGLAEELSKRPGQSVPELLEALQIFWAGHPTRPGLREVDHVHLCSPYARAHWLLPRVTRIPSLALQDWNTNFRLADDAIPAWLAWWEAYDHVAPSLWPEQCYQGRLAKAAGSGPRHSETSGWHLPSKAQTQAAEGDAVLALATRGDRRPQDLKRLDTFIRKTHESEKLQRAAILSAGCLADRAYRDVVRQGLLNPSSDVQCASAWAAGQLGDPWLAPDLKKLEAMPKAQPGTDLGLLARTALIRIGDEDILLDLKMELTHEEENRREEALRSLAHLPRERLRDVLAQALTQATDMPKLELSAVPGYRIRRMAQGLRPPVHRIREGPFSFRRGPGRQGGRRVGRQHSLGSPGIRAPGAGRGRQDGVGPIACRQGGQSPAAGRPLGPGHLGIGRSPTPARAQPAGSRGAGERPFDHMETLLGQLVGGSEKPLP